MVTMQRPIAPLTSVISDLLDTSIAVVVRTSSSDGIVALASAIANGGVKHIEITTTVPNAIDSIRAISENVGDRIHVGAGTVLDSMTAVTAIRAGARFIVSPILEPTVIDTAHQYGVPVIPGCLTPTEVARALKLGADCIKLFPGQVATPAYFRDLLGPFPSARLMPTGNVNRTTAPQYLAAGAIAVGVGKSIVEPSAFAAGDWETITLNAVEFLQLLHSAKGGSS